MATIAEPTSIVELAARGIAGAIARRRTARAKRHGAGALGQYVTEVLGTLLAMAAFTVAAFVVGFALGMVVTGVALLLLDFKVAVVRRARAVARRGAR